MNKQFLIVLLAVCLVSTHAFVKRDAPTSADVQAQLDIAKAKLEELFNKVNQEIQKITDPEVVKKNANDLIDAATKLANNFKPATEAKPAA